MERKENMISSFVMVDKKINGKMFQILNNMGTTLIKNVDLTDGHREMSDII